MSEVIGARVAAAEDATRVADVLAAAFQDDPVWGWAFPDPSLRPAQLAVWWRFLTDAAMRYPWVWVTPAIEAAAVWIPPGGAELSTEEQARAAGLLNELVGGWSATVLEAMDRFDAAHPHDEPHYYLSLLGTDPTHRGRGIGMALLAANLARIDEEHLPAYLESTNPANNARYARLGFEQRGAFSVVDGGPIVTTMWRSAR
ncbi:MAG: GNAT family N-acetyltransferase [Candidatus Dormiibacterota bacterium]